VTTQRVDPEAESLPAERWAWNAAMAGPNFGRFWELMRLLGTGEDRAGL
jgi:hypothetical protein